MTKNFCNPLLGRIVLARDFDKRSVHESLVSRVHALVDLVDNSERHVDQGLERHEVRNGRDRALPARLTLERQLLQVFGGPELDEDEDTPLIIGSFFGKLDLADAADS